MTAFLENLRRRRAEHCPHGLRHGECQTCTPRKDEPPPPLNGLGRPKAEDFPRPAPAAGSTPKPPTGRPRKPSAALEPGSARALAYQAARQFSDPFTLADLVVRCWEFSEKKFGLDGYPNHPDSQKIRSVLYGSRGLIARGLVRHAGAGKFEAAKAKGDSRD